ncbi:3-keto-5-aminohexanoate cleavage protein [Pseudonocardia sp. DLS-67]
MVVDQLRADPAVGPRLGEQQELATSNAQQVRKIRAALEDLSFEIATPDDTRKMLGLKGADALGF